MPTKIKKAPAAGTTNSMEVMSAELTAPQCAASRQYVPAAEPTAPVVANPEWPRTTEARAKLAALRQEKKDIKSRLDEVGYASPLAAGLIKRRNELDHEIGEAAVKLEQFEEERRLFDFKPNIDVQQSYFKMVSGRLKGHFDYLEDMVDDMDQQILCQAIELMKREHGTESDDWLQPGEFIQSILFVLGAGKTAEVA